MNNADEKALLDTGRSFLAVLDQSTADGVPLGLAVRKAFEALQPGLRRAGVADDVILSSFGEPLCARCHHPHTDAAWVSSDPDDGTCWNAGSLVCGCPKFITPAVQKMRQERWERERAK